MERFLSVGAGIGGGGGGSGDVSRLLGSSAALAGAFDAVAGAVYMSEETRKKVFYRACYDFVNNEMPSYVSG